MNTKKSKNKKPNKSPNPNPQQTPENVKVPEKVDANPIVEKVESELKIDERVPEITSGVTTASEVCKEGEVESPKKPKRSRGKKKKQDKDSETEENLEDQAVPPVCSEDKKISVEIKASDVKIETINLEIENVTPTSRKKKNKNKKAGNQDTIPIEKEKLEKTPVVVSISESEKVNVSFDITPEVLVKPTEEVQPAKKKNKKKKRHDSEKSDKAEEISCTAAFQKLLNLDDETSKKTDEKPSLDSILSTEDTITGDIITGAPDDDKEEEMLDVNKENIKEEVFKAVGGKNKKKNKKGRTSKTDDEQQTQSRNESQCDLVSEDNLIISTNILNPTTDIVMEKVDDIKTHSEEVTLEILTEGKTTESKAKISKPVDKKGKQKLQLVAKEEQSESSILDVPKTDKKENVAKVTTETLDTKEIALQEIVKPKDFPLMEETKDEAILTSLVELINMPPTSVGKKRKKSPKPLKDTRQIKKEGDEQSHETEKSIKSKGESSDSESVITIENPVLSDQQKESIIPDPVTVLKSESEPAQEILTEILETKHDVLSVTKPGKKRKKSPKPPIKSEIGETSKFDKERDQNVTENKQILTRHENDEMIDIYFDMPHMEDIEIRSVKTDDSGESTCEVRPDSIQYPRANSQQQADDNNNTVIQEVSQTDDTKLAIPIVMPDTPFIQGDSPLTSPEMLSVRVVDTEVSVIKTNEPEKTDIKSKMMEVNQDMEELRLSIEKSLAELTSIEKNEAKVEEQYEKQIQSQSQDTKKLDTSVLEVNLSPTDVKLEEQITDIDAKNKNVETKPEFSPIAPETDVLGPLMMPMPTDIIKEVESLKEGQQQKHTSSVVIPPPPPMPDYIKDEEIKQMVKENKATESSVSSSSPPVCPARRDQKGKGKSKKKGKQEAGQSGSHTESTSTGTKEASKEAKREHKTEASQDKGKQHSDVVEAATKYKIEELDSKEQSLSHFEPIENFEDAMTSSIDDVNKSFEMIATEAQCLDSHVNPEIKIIAPLEETKVEKKDEKINPVSQPKNLLGHPVIPVRSNKMDYKKEKNKSPNAILAKVKIKDSVQIQSKQSRQSQTENIQKFMKKKSIDESFSTLMNENEEFVYKYSFRKVFLPSVCHVCNKDLKQTRVACSYCNLLFYCSSKHKDDDWPQHQALCFAVSTIVHLKEQKHIYEDAKNITGHNYRLLRMQMIVSCEKILKRKLLPWEQEALLYPRMCSNVDCREWRQNKLVDCDGCWQIAYCSSHPDHLPNSHKKWCKSYSLYQKLVCHQQTKGRLEPKMPSGVIMEQCQIPDTMNEVLASMYKEKIDMNDVEYAALTQLSTAPLTAVYSFQIYNNKMNSIYANGTYKKSSFTVHVVGAELQFEADALNKWELFFLHLRPDIKNLTICLIASNLNPSNLPLDLLGKVRLCEYCRQDKRRLLFSFQDKKSYSEYYKSDDFSSPDMVCTFNPSIQRSTIHNGKDTWPSTINTILKQKIPFIITSYSMEELCRDLGRIKECSQVEFNIISEPKLNSFSSVRPDRNFITDEEMPLLFKNYCFAVICGVF